MSARRLAAILAAVLGGLFLAASLFLRRRQVEVGFSTASSLPPLSVPPLPNASASSVSVPLAATSGGAYTNEMQTGNLEKQKAEMGISGVMTAPPGDDQGGRGALLNELAQAGSPEQAISALRQLSMMNNASQEQAGRRPAVYLEGRTPKLLAQPDGASPAQKGGPISAQDWFAVSTKDLGQSRALADAQSWSGLWQALFPGQPVPSVDFKSGEIAAVIVGPSPAGDGLEIVSAGQEGGAFVVRYRQTRSLSAAAFPPGTRRWLCALKKIARPNGSVRFTEVP